jgi:hypothetical protein
MTVAQFNETIVEEACVSILEALGYEIAFGPDVTGDTVLAIRTLPSETILGNRLTDSLAGVVTFATFILFCVPTSRTRRGTRLTVSSTAVLVQAISLLVESKTNGSLH